MMLLGVTSCSVKEVVSDSRLRYKPQDTGIILGLEPPDVDVKSLYYYPKKNVYLLKAQVPELVYINSKEAVKERKRAYKDQKSEIVAEDLYVDKYSIYVVGGNGSFKGKKRTSRNGDFRVRFSPSDTIFIYGALYLSMYVQH